MKVDTDRLSWGGGSEGYLMGINSHERPETLSNNARLGKSDGYPRLPNNFSNRHHLRKWHGAKGRIPRLPIQKWLGGLLFCPSLFCMGSRGIAQWRMAHFAKCEPIPILFRIREYSALFPNRTLLESFSGLSCELIPTKHATPSPSADSISI